MVGIGRALALARRRAVSPPRAARGPLTLHGRRLLLARLAFAAFAALALWLDLTGYVRTVRDADGLWLAAIGDQEEARAALAAGGPRLVAYLASGALFLLGEATYYAAAFLLARRSREAIALLVALFLVATSAVEFPPNLFALLATEPARAAAHLAVSYCFPLLFILLFFLFPDGRFTPRWTVVPAVLWAVSLAHTFFVARALGSGGRDLIPFALLLLAIVVAQAQRYRRVSGPVERQQTKWFLGGLGVALATFIGGNVLLAANGALDAAAPTGSVGVAWTIFGVANGLAGLCVPLGLAIAVLRYRLFAIDAILNRALVYGALTAAVVGLYVLVVGYLGALFRTDGAGGNLAISLVATALVAVLFQPLRERLQRGANRLLYGQRDEPYAVISRLGRRLEATLAPDAVLPAIVTTVREALRLPYAAVALHRDGELVTAAAAGTPVPDPLRLPLVYQREPVGALLLAPRAPGEAFGPADRRLLDDLARQAGVAAHAVRLTADLQRSRERLVTTREEERRRMRRDLHDGLGPQLAALILKLETARNRLGHDRAADALLADLAASTQAAVDDVRRLVYGLRPPALDELGLVGALQAQAAHSARAAPDIAVEAPAALPPLPAAVEVAAYRIAQEALTNAIRHAGARRCTVRLSHDAARAQLAVEVTDDGRGIAAADRAGVGLASMRERAAELGGRCVVGPAPGGGTRVDARLPCGPPAPGTAGSRDGRAATAIVGAADRWEGPP